MLFTKTFSDFNGNRWQKSEIKVFNFDIKKDIKAADIGLTFTHTLDPQYKNVPLELVINRPDGTRDNVFINLQLEDGSGNNMSECEGHSCELNMSVKEGIEMTAGSYVLTIENKFEEEYLPNITALGITVEDEN
ncbi:MAG: hypothetical protein BM557_03975 [Flavobacterium sp. MedPE-SWcel]|nr:MAG: hypothetical protein BM557_03975 [Flavobacterium sp. MedPE-SWcel]